MFICIVFKTVSNYIALPARVRIFLEIKTSDFWVVGLKSVINIIFKIN